MLSSSSIGPCGDHTTLRRFDVINFSLAVGERPGIRA